MRYRLIRPSSIIQSSFVAVVLAVATSASAADSLRQQAAMRFGVVSPIGPETLEKPDVQLGHSLFWDQRLSVNGKTACADCHPRTDWGADSRQFSPDASGKNTSRNSQTVFNAVLQPSLRWVGDRKSGAHQAERSLTGSLGFKSADDVVPLLRKYDYRDVFQRAFPKDPEPLTPQNYASAIEAYERTLVTPAPFDRFLQGDEEALTDEQKRGLRQFITVGCADCHKGKLLGGESLAKFGVAADYWTLTKSDKRDKGLFEATKDDADLYKFRVSMLRNIEKTSPYFHDGSVKDLKTAIQVMGETQLGERLSATAVAEIQAFLKSLAGEVPANYQRPPGLSKQAKE